MSSAATRVSELFIEFVAASLAFVGLFGHQIRTHRASKFSLDLWPDVLKTFLEPEKGNERCIHHTRHHFYHQGPLGDRNSLGGLGSQRSEIRGSLLAASWTSLESIKIQARRLQTLCSFAGAFRG